MPNEPDTHTALVGMLRNVGAKRASVAIESPGPAGMAVIQLDGLQYRAKVGDFVMTLFGAKPSTVKELLKPYLSEPS